MTKALLQAWLAEVLYRCSQREERWRYRSSNMSLIADGKRQRFRLEKFRNFPIVMRERGPKVG
jgi:hypothetical protein